MKITDLKTTKKGRFSVFIDGNFDGVLHLDMLMQSHLQIGDEATREQLEILYEQTAFKLCKERAMNLLAGRAYTQKLLTDKLAMFASIECARAASQRMTELGLLNDADYAWRFASDCLNLKGFSHRRTAQELAKKGIDKYLIEETLEMFEIEPQTAIAQIILHKYLRYLCDEKGVNKTTNALIRLGYSYGDIRTVIANLAEDEDYYNEE